MTSTATCARFPYTTLFRSRPRGAMAAHQLREQQAGDRAVREPVARVPGRDVDVLDVGAVPRSEEHTSELQPRRDLVCRLLLEIKNGDNRKRHLRPPHVERR